jgi:hypothetical protein
LFSQGVVTVACVVSKTGDFLGVLSRSCFTEQHIDEVLAQGPPSSSGAERNAEELSHGACDRSSKKLEQDGIVEGKGGAPIPEETGKFNRMKEFVEKVRGGKPKEEVVQEILMTHIGKDAKKTGKVVFDIDDIPIEVMADLEDFTKQLKSYENDSTPVLTV